MQAAARPGCAGPKREVGAWVARSGCDLGTEAKQGGIGVGHVEKPSCWGKQPCRLARRTIFLLLENSPIGPGVLGTSTVLQRQPELQTSHSGGKLALKVKMSGPQ